MLRHALKLIWNRKRANALIVVELAIAFFIVFFVSALGFHTLHLWNQPLGFEWRDTFEVMINPGGEWSAEDGQTLRRLLRTVRNEPSVEFAHVSMPPFRGWNWISDVAWEGRKVDTMANRMTDGAPRDLGVELVEGRWFDETDATSDVFPVLLDENLRDILFPGVVVIGADINERDPDEQEHETWKVIGVFKTYRQQGELSRIRPYLIGRFPIEDPEAQANALQVRQRESAGLDFEQELQRVIEAEAPQWSMTVTPLSILRGRQIKEVVLPLTIGGIVAGFLLLMVAFGLFGVLWQDVTRRTDELGLRRALGASRRRVYQQIVLETVVLAALASLAGTVVALQLPISGINAVLDWRSSISGLSAALSVLFGLAAGCSLYPAWLAARRTPADALRYE